MMKGHSRLKDYITIQPHVNICTANAHADMQYTCIQPKERRFAPPNMTTTWITTVRHPIHMIICNISIYQIFPVLAYK